MACWRNPSTHERMETKEETPSTSSMEPSSWRTATLSWPTSSATRACFEGVHPDPHLHAVGTLDVPRLVGQGRLHVDILGHLGPVGLAPSHLALDAVHPERALGRAIEVPRHEVPVPEAEPQADRRRAPGLAPVGELGCGTGPHRLEELDQRRRRHQRGDRAHVAQTRRAQLQQRISATRIPEVDAGDGEVERDLLVRLEVQVGQVEGVALDAVAVLLLPWQALGEDRDALVAQAAACRARRPAGGRRARSG